MRGLIEQRFGALAFMEKLQRQPRQAQLSQKLLDCGFSPALIRKLVDGLPADGDELAWAPACCSATCTPASASRARGRGRRVRPDRLDRRRQDHQHRQAGRRLCHRHGAANLGLITLDAYRIAAHEQLRAYGRILGVPVHTAHDRASLEDLLDLLSASAWC
jgi:flagellar biosynthesis protein FlhF